MAAWALSIERGDMMDHMSGRLDSSCAWQRWISPAIWLPHRLAGIFLRGSVGWGLGMEGGGAWDISGGGACSEGEGGTMA